jgi:uncharacterized protein (DUF2461 family)
MKGNKGDPQVTSKFRMYDGLLYSRDNPGYPYWRACMLANFEARVIKFVRVSHGHLDSDECFKIIADSFYTSVKEVRRETTRIPSACEVYQIAKYNNRCFEACSKSYLPKEGKVLLSVVIYGSLPTARNADKHTYICLLRCF